MLRSYSALCRCNRLIKETYVAVIDLLIYIYESMTFGWMYYTLAMTKQKLASTQTKFAEIRLNVCIITSECRFVMETGQARHFGGRHFISVQSIYQDK